ncbi:MAG: hypothetical protein P8Y96_01830 [Desulfuromonadales bacterium]|jgi:hypothetical protein
MQNSDWPTLLQRTRDSLDRLDASEKNWIRERLKAIESLQTALDGLFCAADGSALCAACAGACCGCGRHHLTLGNLLAFLLESQEPPVPDPEQTCPYLGPSGCRLPVRSRPYNCITFFCEHLEERLSNADRLRLRELDRMLRREYQRLADRYPAASLRGLWIAAGQRGDGPLFGDDETIPQSS